MGTYERIKVPCKVALWDLWPVSWTIGYCVRPWIRGCGVLVLAEAEVPVEKRALGLVADAERPRKA